MSAEHEPTQHNPNARTVLSPERGDGMNNPEPATPEDKVVQHGLREFIDNPLGKATVVAAGLLAAAGATFGVVNANEAGPSSSQTVATGPSTLGPEATSTPSATGSPEVLSVQSLEIPTGLAPDQLGSTIAQRLSQWEMAGATPDIRTAYVKSGGSFDYLTSVAEQNGSTFADALFVPGYESKPDLSIYIANKTKSNANSLENWAKTTLAPTSADKEPFSRSMTANSTSVTSQSDGTTQLAIDATEYDNASQNHIGQIKPDELVIDGNEVTITVTLETVDGHEKISEFDAIDHK
jgi:hypothetical protein